MKPTVLCMLISPFVLFAQQNSGAWTHIGPSPAAVEAIVVDPQDTGTIFLGSTAGGVRKSVDRGITWSAVNSGLTTLAVKALAMDASGPQTVYAGTIGGGLFKTGDGGATWRAAIPASARCRCASVRPGIASWSGSSAIRSVSGSARVSM